MADPSCDYQVQMLSCGALESIGARDVEGGAWLKSSKEHTYMEFGRSTPRDSFFDWICKTVRRTQEVLKDV